MRLTRGVVVVVGMSKIMERGGPCCQRAQAGLTTLCQLAKLGAVAVSGWILALLVGGAFVAGWIDAIVGGGGLIQLPLLFFGLADHSVAAVSGTNKMSSVGGASAATMNYLRRIRVHWPVAMALCGCAYLGSSGGALLNRQLPRDVFAPLLFLALLVVGCYTWRRPELGIHHQDRLVGWRRICAAGAIGVVVGFYDGLLGPGAGTFFIIGLVSILGYGFLHASAYAKLANLTTNVAAIVVFARGHHIVWLVALPMMVANLTGGYVGAKLALKHGNSFVRIVFLIVVGLLTLRMGYETVRLGWRALPR
ncbi:MAG: sulfite exporter TauE/SafE family protein [Propionibacteriaceae bacterium]